MESFASCKSSRRASIRTVNSLRELLDGNSLDMVNLLLMNSTDRLQTSWPRPLTSCAKKFLGIEQLKGSKNDIVQPLLDDNVFAGECEESKRTANIYQRLMGLWFMPPLISGA